MKRSRPEDDGGRLSASELAEVVREAVENTEVVDVHTHLFPASHGDLMLWGIDELLTYHYLVSEFFMVAPVTLSHQEFFKKPKSQQADLVWEHLFVQRLPISEAQIGVVTVLSKLGLQDFVAARDLIGIRAWFAKQDPEEYVELIMKLGKVRYVVMTNIPFEPKEAAQWNAGKKGTSRFKAALRIDPLLKGDWGTIAACLREMSFPETLEGAREYLKHWARKMDAIYLMASTPADFAYGDGDAPKAVGWPSATRLIDEVMVPVAKELSLPLAMKLGARRGMVPGLNPCGGGDGVVSVDLGPLRDLCSRNPDLKFLATVLSRVNQHEVCVMAQKFRNLHLYGCWWYCNNPSMIDEISRMRLEMLGTAFTIQHSDCRVLDQLLYKWIHSRQTIAPVLVEQFLKLHKAGWPISREEVFRDVGRLFGGAYEDFMAR